MISFIKKYATRKNILFGIIYILITNLVLFPFFPKIISNVSFSIDWILDLKIGFDYETVIKSFELMQPEGRFIYKISTIFIDTPYAVIYGFTYSSIFYLLFDKNSKYKSLLLIFPIMISVFDILENLFIVNYINNYPNISDKMVFLGSIANQLKWIFAIITFIIFIIGLTKFLIKKKSLKTQN
jgi:hypothetical protein